MSIAYFCLLGLDTLGALQTKVSFELRQNWTAWIYSCQLPMGGFRGTTGADVGCESGYAPAHVAATYFAIASLVTLGDDLTRLHRAELLLWLPRLQRGDGSLACMLLNGGEPGGETDMRFVYCACAIMKLLGATWPEATLQRICSYIESCQAVDGGIGSRPFAESHAGHTYCAVAAMALTDSPIPIPMRQKLAQCLCRLQTPDGGFSGRVNKPSDTCYSFWVGAALQMLSCGHGICAPANVSFLLAHTQHPFGGFSKDGDAPPDPLHSCLALLSLSLHGQNLEPIDPKLCITQRAWTRRTP